MLVEEIPGSIVLYSTILVEVAIALSLSAVPSTPTSLTSDNRQSHLESRKKVYWIFINYLSNNIAF
jgi:hypothetical protein